MDSDRVIYQVPPYRGYVLPRPMAVHPQRVNHPFWNDASRLHLDFMFDQTLPHHMQSYRGGRIYGPPWFPNPYREGDIFYLHDLWTRPNRPIFRQTYSQGQMRSPQNTAPIVDFPVMANPKGEEPWSASVEEIDPGRMKEIPTNNEEDSIDHLDSVSVAGENRQAESIPESEYVPLETIRRVKEQARAQAMRMKDHRSNETIEMANMNDAPNPESNARYDRPRRREFPRNDWRKPQRVVHNPASTQNNSRSRFVGVSNREWTPGGSSIPDGIIADGYSNVSSQRLVSIPDSARYATISGSSDVQSSNEAPELPERPQDLQPGKDRGRDGSTKKKRYTSSAEPLTERRKEYDDATTCKHWICVFVLVVSLLVFFALVGVVLLFFFSPIFEGCREETGCTRKTVFITAGVVAGCFVLCLILSCCCWCLFVTYSHIINRRRAYPIHHRPSTHSTH